MGSLKYLDLTPGIRNRWSDVKDQQDHLRFIFPAVSPYAWIRPSPDSGLTDTSSQGHSWPVHPRISAPLQMMPWCSRSFRACRSVAGRFPGWLSQAPSPENCPDVPFHWWTFERDSWADRWWTSTWFRNPDHHYWGFPNYPGVINNDYMFFGRDESLHW